MNHALRSVFTAIVCAFLACAANAEGYPSRVVTLIVPFAPGGPTDLMGRTIADGLSKEFGQAVIVENKPGATGIVGLGALERSAADGHTLLLLPSSTAVAHVAQKKPFQLSQQATPLGNILTQSAFIFVNPKVIDVTSLQELVAYLRKNPGTGYTSSGAGSPSHLHTQAWADGLGLELTHVAYRGIAPAVMDVIGGRVPLILSTLTSIKPYIEDGSIRAIAALSPERQAYLPNVKTSTEQGFPDFRVPVYVGIAVTAGTPEPIVLRLRAALKRIVEGDAYRKVFDGSDGIPEYIDGPKWGALIQDSYDSAAKIARERNLTFQ
ncbi:Bug family tripartite tricarboxylate transporter substrate binding protein [Bradyrhizobium iriomotense]|uniref:Bug family tripartite tricarboxylate transporter substrate binding protein n=1 Tax=Bradyrhizobium iriomotense TaxID=441950 RepID=UPI001B8A6EA2|nr:tripartite tricarboxylate transporter substrate binding protein [Bradyrhizobium iriomotense]MBR0781899.1 tripartite tricarboxylate transporter substrate binding protein [Bradyrhizobium iriomotense]